VNTIDPDRVHSLVETHLDNLIADIQKELAVETSEAAARFFSGLKWEALVTIVSADMQRYASFACGDPRHVRPSPTSRHVRR
jgi:hypothetical protein